MTELSLHDAVEISLNILQIQIHTIIIKFIHMYIYLFNLIGVTFVQ